MIIQKYWRLLKLHWIQNKEQAENIKNAERRKPIFPEE